jgi:choline dehydrogenase-like flavoprotein
METAFDYVIVGAGSAGATLAARLSDDGESSVCLIEAGPTHKHFSVSTPGLLLLNMVTKKRNWGFETVPQKGLNGRKGYQPRGKMLGGSSGSNAMIYIRGHKSDYDHWAELGNKGWAYKDVLPFFKKAEHYEGGESDYHGTEGPLHVTHQKEVSPLNQTFLKAAQSLQIPLCDDFNGQDQEGVGLFDVTQKRGKRWSAANAYLDPAEERKNLTVLTDCLAEKILLENKRAIGVQIRTKPGQRTLSARREVIVSAGAFGSPHLLLLSGIGPTDKLAPHDIDAQHVLPGVGENLQDHVDWIANYQGKGSLHKDTIGFSLPGTFNMIKEIFKYRKDGTGLLSSNIAESGGFLYLDRGEPAPDIQLHFIISIVDDHGRKLHWGHGFSLHVCLLRPKSRGRVSLASSDSSDAPLIDPAFLEDDRDLEKLYQGARLTQRLMQSAAFDDIRGRPIYGTEEQDEARLKEDIRNRADTIYHPVGTCKMGTDKMAVVDERLRVHGLKGLRVIDASIMPQVISGNTNAPTIMIGEKGAAMIKEDWREG